MTLHGIDVFYYLTPAFRACIVRMDGPTAMGIGHAETADHRHYWVMLFAGVSSTGC